MERHWITVPVHHLDRGRRDVEVHTATWQGPADGPVFVCVHGLGGSHVNWSWLAPLLAARGTVHAPDLAGFGLTLPSGRRASIDDNLDLLAGFVRTVSPHRQVTLVGNSMGGLLTLLLAACRPRLVSSAVLIAPASPRPVTAPVDRAIMSNFAMMAVPLVGERWIDRRQAAVTPEEQVRETMLLCAVDADALPADVVDAHVDIVRQRREMAHARSAFLQAARSLLVLTGPRAGELWRAAADVQAPTLVLHGERDRLVTAAGMAVLARRRPDWTFVSYDDLGHIPMVEAPARVAADIGRWLDDAEVAEPLAG